MRKTQSDYEKKIGLKYYQNTDGFVGGNLKEKPEDFEVREVSNFDYKTYSKQKEKDYKYLVIEIKAKNWDTNNLIREISNRLGISKKRISFAGTKDKRAVTTQLLTLYNVKKEEISQLNIRGIEFNKYGLSNHEINIGDLVGNNFKITIRNIKNLDRAQEIKTLLEKDGIINYYGPQRFGKTRPITHLVGEKIVQGEYELALKTYLTKTFNGEKKEIRETRETLAENWGDKGAYKVALKNFPNYLRYERSMLHHLIKKPNDSVGALRKLPKNLLMLFIHAYQSYLFNKVVNERIERGFSLGKPLMGDVVCYTDLETGVPNRNVTERVTKKNKKKINKMIEKRKAHITAPLFGKKTKRALGKMGKIEEKILEQHNLQLLDFEIKMMPEISSSGLRREVKTFPKFDSVKENKNSVIIEFFLPKGSYATCVTREFRGEA